MKIDQELGRLSPERESVLTIGVFDGVHRGHQHLISHLVAEASRTGRLAGVVIFRNHPASVLLPDFKPRFLTTLEDRVRLIQGIGTDFTVPITFDRELSMLRAARFAGLLQGHLRMGELVVGPDFAMGQGREGDVGTLTTLGPELGFSVQVVDALAEEDGQALSSTSIREAIALGDVTRVADLLGRNFLLSGTVVRGKGLGTPMGFPTVNLWVPEGMAVPGSGIYAAWAHLGGQRYMAATSVGVRPTFKDAGHAIEAFLIDFNDDLYGQDIRLEFVRRLRDEVKFDSVRALQEQVGRDVDKTRAVLKSAGPA
jgi:riboflavin kinase/FMN adenylyltransferase